MGIFDNLFGAFSSRPAQNAANAQIAGLNRAYGTATGDINRGLGQAQGYLTSGLGQAQNYLNQGYDLYGRGYDLYSPLAAAAGHGATAYGNAVGLGGQAGLDTARQTFTSLPGYQEGYNTGIDTLERRAGARGMLGSGNTSADTLKYASDYANQKYGNYLSALQPYLGLQGQYTGAQAGLLGQQAGIRGQQGSNALNIAGQQGANALDVAKLQGGLGFQTQQGIGQANAQAALAPYQTSQNFINTLLGLGKTAASAFGGGMGVA